MGEDYEAMNNFKLFVGGEPVDLNTKDCQLVAEPLDLIGAINKVVEEEETQFSNETFDFNATIESKDLIEQVRKLFEKPNRVFTRQERKLFMRTVERHGWVEFTFHDWQGAVEGVGIGSICLLCNTPRQMKSLLRLKNVGNVSYKIRKRHEGK